MLLLAETPQASGFIIMDNNIFCLLGNINRFNLSPWPFGLQPSSIHENDGVFIATISIQYPIFVLFMFCGSNTEGLFLGRCFLEVPKREVMEI